jgi:hypothetical protein
MSESRKRSKWDLFSFFLIILYLVSFSLLTYFLITGFDYYSSSLIERAHHELYKFLKPGGFRSHAFGMVGSGMLILLLLYSVRKRVRLFQRMGPLSRWLNLHIFLGATGPLFIILHSTLKLNGLVAVSFWSMIAVALSGILGRYLYLQIPRNIIGQELSLNEAIELNQNLMHQLTRNFQIDATEIQEIESLLLKSPQREQNVLKSLFSLITSDISFFLTSRKIKKQMRTKFNIPHIQMKVLFSLLQQRAYINQRLNLWNKIHQLFHYWHVFHKPFALVMYIIMVVHITVAIWLGYRWIF